MINAAEYGISKNSPNMVLHSEQVIHNASFEMARQNLFPVIDSK